MNAVLQNPHLIHEIFEWLDDGSDGPARQMLFYNAALVCRSFRNPAQSLLWRRIGSILPLFCLLPKFQQDLFPRTASTPPTWVLSGPVEPEDARRLLLFGSRVHLIKSVLPSPDDEGAIGVIDPSVFVLVACSLGGQQLFPNLRRFSLPLDNSQITGLSILHLLHSHMLRSISFLHLRSSSVCSVRDVSVFLSQRSRYSRGRLTRLNISFTNQAILDLIPSFQNLSWLQIQMDRNTPVTAGFLVVLSDMENLSYLCLKTLNLTSPRNGTRRLLFERLDTLILSCPFEESQEFFTTVKMPVLRHLNYQFVLPAAPHLHTYAWADLFFAIASAAHSKLRDITVRPARWSHSLYSSHVVCACFDNSYPGVPFDSFATALLQFNLEKLSLDFPLFESISHEDLQRIMHTWPALRTLHLRSASEETVDIRVLTQIALGLPFLTHLTIDIDLLLLNTDPSTIPAPSTTNSSVRSLKIRFFNHDNSHRKLNTVGFIMHTVFPNLTTVEALEGFEDCDSTLSEHVTLLQMTGENERRMVGAPDKERVLYADFSDVEGAEEEQREAEDDELDEW